MNGLAPGWMMYSEYCRSRGIEQNGQHIRLLAKAPEHMKGDVTPTSSKSMWAVDAKALDEWFESQGEGND